MPERLKPYSIVPINQFSSLWGWPRRMLAGLALAYLASFLSYHFYILISRSPTGWFLVLKDNPILIVFTPSCIVGLVVGGIYAMTFELLISSLVLMTRTASKHSLGIENHC